jgi:GSCFA family
MQFHYEFDIKKLSPPVEHRHRLLLSGSCFTDHIGNRLRQFKFRVLENPNGILFNPVSITRSVVSYIENKRYSADELFYHNECWHSWEHHSRFSHPDADTALQMINGSQEAAHGFLKEADWLLLTLGSAFVYELKEGNRPVANCHKVLQGAFNRRLLGVEEVMSALDTMLHRLFLFNPQLKIIFTISPVRHLREGVIENNRSKAVLIQCVHQLADKFDKVAYFPSYELVLDDLRDYRFYAEDMVHPNYQATAYVWEKFVQACIAPDTQTLMKEIDKINAAKAHRAFNPSSEAHRQFLQTNYQKVQDLKLAYPYIDFNEELVYFGNGG